MKSMLSPSHNFSILDVILSISTSSSWPSKRGSHIQHITYALNMYNVIRKRQKTYSPRFLTKSLVFVFPVSLDMIVHVESWTAGCERTNQQETNSFR